MINPRFFYLFLLVAQKVKGEGDVKSILLNGHNLHRGNAGLKEVSWDVSLEKSAVEFAKQLGNTAQNGGEYRSFHRKNITRVVETNVFWRSVKLIKDFGELTIAQKAMKEWYKQVIFYRFPGQNNSYNECDWGDSNDSNVDPYESYKVGNLTNMMWEGTEMIGCGGHYSNNDYYVYVCHYSPAINQNEPPNLFNDSNFLNLCKNEPGQGRIFAI